ncbi:MULTISPECIES: acyl-CoA dehydrogenase family protein [Halobacteriovorax]|uniref:Acyl-CoA dehydrogenase n=1 Tax=Halobacteriovorax vibrionivorans TaxID=2152716 RepID=A0ABY0ID70_9BACT|nr:MULTISPECIES: acyl-CoA dehydrogenase family protein [Halobacteriovorax]AYF44539.1 acyl-CoA dehydrogenase, C-terminal domain protein [Halobacteriovorax sp. BALOs_7]RZF20592.1 acyl-CoA dehydrogenase [Halobacteriovorax vibrionivorans]TGD47506.1 acyl-CoA dehydrogenase [Halobacteriovorax sp. Y22]
MNYFSDEKEWQWMLKNAVDWKAIIPLYYKEFPTADGFNNQEEVISFIEELMTQTGSWAADAVYNRAEAIDVNGAGVVKDGRTIPGKELSEFYREATELGAFGLCVPTEFGGMGLPAVALMILLEQLSRACNSQCTQLAFFTSIADMVHRFCDHETAERLIPKIVAGELSGSMNLTEPGCGSDLGMIKTSATPVGDGTYKLNGSKIFITNGGGGIGFVLARIKGAPEGLEGISMFICEQDDPTVEGLNYTVAKNEHKMGMHGSFTCEIVYENSVARLIGEEGKGFRYMLHLMNEARIAVGMQALGGIEGCIGYAKNYAQERVQFDKPISELPLMKRNLEDFETERDALRALLVDTISSYDIFQKLDLKKNEVGELTKEEEAIFKNASIWTRKRTPLVKYYACEAYTQLSTKAIQVLGGYGFMEEYPVSRYHRDSFGPLLYEGTSQIQALMALKDMIKYVAKNPQKYFSNLFIKHPAFAWVASDNLGQRELSGSQYTFKKNLIKLIMKCLKPEKLSDLTNPKAWMNEDNVDKLMLHAETICQGLSYLETLRVLANHSSMDKERYDLFKRYHTLVTPRLTGIYKDWEIR